MPEEEFIERHILIGLIVSTEYLDEIHDVWNPRLLKSPTAKKMADWCLEYYAKYNKAPGPSIEGIYFEKLRKGKIRQELAEELEEDILPGLSEEYERADTFNVEYLLDRTRDYFTERNLELHQQEIEALVQEGKVGEAEAKAFEYQPLEKELDSDINLADPESLDRIGRAFESPMKSIVQYPGAVGELVNPQLTRDALVAFLAPEKRGKSWIMLDLARRAVSQRLNVAFFQAGDMSEAQQLRRLGIHLAKRSDQERYCGEQYQPVKDCKRNQTGECQKEVRESFMGLDNDEGGVSEQQARSELTFPELVELHKHNPDYKACYNCKEYRERSAQLGAPWLKKTDVGSPLEKTEAEQLFEDYFVENNRQLMISTHPNNTLSVPKISSHLDKWYRQGFVPDVIVVDYADLLTGQGGEYRHQQNEIWKGMRGLSEERHCLFVTATQADANSYSQGRLNMSNFSEDKRKLAHVTAMYGLNQDPAGREKDIGMMRINELVIREGEGGREVTVLQNLKRGQPILTSYW